MSLGTVLQLPTTNRKMKLLENDIILLLVVVAFCCLRVTVTLPKTNIIITARPWKRVFGKRSFPFWETLFSKVGTLTFREGNIPSCQKDLSLRIPEYPSMFFSPCNLGRAVELQGRKGLNYASWKGSIVFIYWFIMAPIQIATELVIYFHNKVNHGKTQDDCKWKPSWWLNQPNWKICNRPIGWFPQVSGWTLKKNRWVATTIYWARLVDPSLKSSPWKPWTRATAKAFPKKTSSPEPHQVVGEATATSGRVDETKPWRIHGMIHFPTFFYGKVDFFKW